LFRSELNYISDVDVVFLAAPTAQGHGANDGADAVGSGDRGDGGERAAYTHDDVVQVGTRLATAVMRICSHSTAEGALWQVDAALRPEGKNGPLVRSLESHREYYQRWAKTWEFQALLKARHAAGDADLSREWLDVVQPMVWEASAREGFVEN